jgi:hypothetical protein
VCGVAASVVAGLLTTLASKDGLGGVFALVCGGCTRAFAGNLLVAA